MIVDMHNHTVRCNHATGTVDAYVERAIEQGVDVYAFTDHAPMDFDPEYRMGFDEMTDYRADVLRARDIYKERIEVLFGYEVDYLPGRMDERVLDADVDFLIGSVHFIDDWGFDNPEYLGRYMHEDIDELWQRYFDLIEAMANTRRFDVVGHLDLIKVFKYLPQREVYLIARDALHAIKAADMTLEVNVAGYRKPIREAYPSRTLLMQAFELEIPITFSSDAHSVDQVGLFRTEAHTLAKSVGYRQCAFYRNRERILVDF